MLKPVASFFVAICCLPASAGGLSSLEKFVESTRSGRADFTQVVTSPPKEGQAPRNKTSTGTFEFERPGRFRFVYRKPFEQTIVADGRTLWMYDVDLNQVTSRDQSKVLGSTPAALIASAPDLSALKKDFELRDAPDTDGLNGSKPHRSRATGSCKVSRSASEAHNWPRSTSSTASVSVRC